MNASRSLVIGLAIGTLLVAGCGTSPVTGRQAAVGASSAKAVRSPLARPALKAAVDGYYAPAAGQSGRALLQALNQIVVRHTDLGYDRARDAMFAEADDVDNDNVVECVYIGRQLSNVTNRSSAYQGGKGLNAEHTWPQSKGAEGVAKADLHHLFSADCHANSTRSSFPFGVVKTVQWEEGGSKLGLDDRGNTVFEPRDEQKGNTARAILYFYTAYGQNGNVSLENFRVEEETLKRWHVQDPVDATEAARNEVVQKLQGNRNPFVDHPEFVGAIGQFLQNGSRGQLVSFSL